MSDVVQKLWGFCHTLRHDGIDYGDYIEQITFLLFLKMADERKVALPKAKRARVGRGSPDPALSKDDRWRSFAIAEIKDRDFKLDSFKWLKEESLDDADDLPEPEELATDAIAELEGAVEELNAVLALLENGEKK